MPPTKKKKAPVRSVRKRKATATAASRRESSKRAVAKRPKRSTRKKTVRIPIETQVESVLESLKGVAEKRVLDDMSQRYNIQTSKAFGVSMSNIQKVAKPLGRDHELAAALWETGWYEARMLTSFVDEPDRVTTSQMDRWAGDFDNWGIVDTLCFNLFDRTPHAWGKVAQWCKREEEFVKRAGFALLWSLTVHDKEATDEQFRQGLVLVLRGASDERHFVKKAVNMALRAIGKRNPVLNKAAIMVARRLAESPNAAARWVGKDALRELTSESVADRLASRRRPAAE